MRRKKADRVNLERFKDPESGGDVIYQEEEIFKGRQHATEDAVKGFIHKLILDPRYDTDDELELGRMAAAYFQIQGAESPTHPIWDWVDDVVDDTMKRRHSSTRKHLRGRRYAAEDDRAMERYEDRSPAVYDEPEEVDVEVVSDTWKVDENYWGLEATDGEITKVRLGNWSDAGWYWDGDGEDLLIFLFRLAKSRGELLEEFAESFPNPEFRRAIERTFNRLLQEDSTGINSPLTSLAYAVTGDNAGWHFGENDRMISTDVDNELEYRLELDDPDEFFYETLVKAFGELRKFGIRLSLDDVDKDALRKFIGHEFSYGQSCSLDEDKIIDAAREDFDGLNIDLDSPWALMESGSDRDALDFYEWIQEEVSTVASECVWDGLEKLMPAIIEWAVKEYGEETPKELGEGETMPSSDPRQMDLPLEAQARIAGAIISCRVHAARIPKEMLRGFEFAQSVEFIYPNTGQKGFGRIMDFTRTDEGLLVSIAPHLYQEEEEWFRQDPHDFVDVHVDNVFPTDKFQETFKKAPWRPRESSYGTETSSPMFSTTGDGELELDVADEMLAHPDMSEMIDVAINMSSRGRNVVWDELARYLQDIYSKYGESAELAAPADWDLVAERVHTLQEDQEGLRQTASTQRSARRGDDLGRPQMHREEGGYKSKKKLFEWLDVEGAPVKGRGNETFGRESMIFLRWPDMDARNEWERRLEDAGFKVYKEYGPGNPVSQIQVSYFKGWHYNE